MPNNHFLLAPLEIFTSSKIDPSTLRNEKVWGCPAYVLHPKLQDGKKLPKWDPHTRQGQYLGKLISYSSSVSLIRNLRTGYISPQFHVVYDNLFQTAMGDMKIMMLLLSTYEVIWFKGRKITQKMWWNRWTWKMQ